MTQVPEQPDREHRIDFDIVVDAYDEAERAMGWYYYLENNLEMPFAAQCRIKRSVSPLKVGQTVQVIGMADEDECTSEIFVRIAYEGSKLAVPLEQLECHSPDKATCQAVADWHYWIARGYEY